MTLATRTGTSARPDSICNLHPTPKPPHSAFYALRHDGRSLHRWPL